MTDLTILRHLAARTHAGAAEVGTACSMAAAEVRARLVSLESRRLVASRSDKTTVPPRRVYVVTGEGRRAAGISDARLTTLQRDDVNIRRCHINGIAV